MGGGCRSRNSSGQGQILLGVENLVADKEFMQLKDLRNWMLHPQVFKVMSEILGPLEMDLFASRLTHQLPKFFSWKPDPAVEATDAPTQNWGRYLDMQTHFGA